MVSVNFAEVEILGKNFFGVEEAIQHFGVNPSKAETVALSEIPHTEGALTSYKDTRILVAVFPMSILEIRAKVKDEPDRLFYDLTWCNGENFAGDRGELGWRLVYKAPVAYSTSKTWQEQQALIGEENEVPSARVMVYTIIGHYLVAGERLFGRGLVRTSSVGSNGCRVDVGYYGGVPIN